MCGLVAMISKSKTGFAYKQSDIFAQMLYADALRGWDSTGVFGINKYGNLKLHKAATKASIFMTTKAYENFDHEIFNDFRIVVGHNRAATRGATTDENAHPFLEGNTCLVHNGTLHKHKHLKDVTVDSHAICHAFDTGDYKEILANDIDGAYALIWYDAKAKHLRIARNKERPLWIVETPTTDFIASEPGMLIWLLERNNVQNPEVKYFEVNTVYSYDIDNLEDGFTTEELPEKKPVPIVLPKPVEKPLGQLVVKAFGENTGTVRSLPFYKNYCYGDTIVFEHLTNTVISDKVTFQGETIDGEATEVSCQVKWEQGNQLNNADYLQGKLIGVSWRGSVPKLILEIDNLKEVVYHQSCNGILVTEDEINTHGGLCDECGSWIDPVKESNEFWVRYKNGRIKSMKCASCVEKDEHLSILLTGEEYVA